MIVAGVKALFRGIAWVFRRVYRRARFTVGYAGKLGRRRTTFNLGKGTKVGDIEMNGPSVPITQVIGLQEESVGALLLPSYLHYADAVSLSMVKALRGTLAKGGGDDLELLRKRTCINGSKTDCWGCGNQICEVRPSPHPKPLRRRHHALMTSV